MFDTEYLSQLHLWARQRAPPSSGCEQLAGGVVHGDVHEHPVLKFEKAYLVVNFPLPARLSPGATVPLPEMLRLAVNNPRR